MSRIGGWMTAHRFASALFLGTLALAVLAGAYVGVSNATDKPGFCGSACHEMAPYHESWSSGPHKGISCVACHVDPGELARFKHKAVALQEVAAHFVGKPTFPLAEAPAVPSERCVACHANVKVTRTGFDHTAHAKRGECVSCHADAGHNVSDASLKQAGVFNATAAESRAVAASDGVAAPGSGKANLAGHVSVACSRCHDMARTDCSSCHKPKHVDRGACTQCHATGARFVFKHPTNRPDCSACHKAPAKHAQSGECAACHNRPGVTWKYAHPTPTPECAQCHARPAQHRTGACTTCHKHPGVSWGFSHPAKANCASCHARPAKHRAGSCTSCHRRAGVNWAFTHPGRGANCAGCHTRPTPHKSGSCSTCHRRAGVNWAFSHPASRSCSSCHKPPAAHYGTGCSSCHTPTKAWRNATFRHGAIPGGEHTYRTWSCVSCHPNGYSSHTCAKCHGNANGPTGG